MRGMASSPCRHHYHQLAGGARRAPSEVRTRCKKASRSRSSVATPKEAAIGGPFPSQPRCAGYLVGIEAGARSLASYLKRIVSHLRLPRFPPSLSWLPPLRVVPGEAAAPRGTLTATADPPSSPPPLVGGAYREPLSLTRGRSTHPQTSNGRADQRKQDSKASLKPQLAPAGRQLSCSGCDGCRSSSCSSSFVSPRPPQKPSDGVRSGTEMPSLPPPPPPDPSTVCAAHSYCCCGVGRAGSLPPSAQLAGLVT